MSVCVCVCERERVCVRERECVCVLESESVCVCVLYSCYSLTADPSTAGSFK